MLSEEQAIPTTRYRSKIEIMATILSRARAERRKVDIMHDASLSFEQAQRYIPLLVEKGLLASYRQSNRQVYAITEKGRKFLEVFSQLEGLVYDPATD